jgi:hypothetical protein
VQDVFHYTDHLIGAELRLGASVKDVMNGEGSLLSHLMKGFQATKTVQIVGNIKHAILELLKLTDDAKLQMLSGPLMMLAPLFMIQVDANVNIQFDDFDEVKEHPMAGPFLASFSQLAEGALGDKEEMMKLPEFTKTGDLSRRESEVKLACEVIAVIHAIIKDMDDSSDSQVEFRGACPKVGASGLVQVKSEGLAEALMLAFMANPIMGEVRG